METRLRSVAHLLEGPVNGKHDRPWNCHIIEFHGFNIKLPMYEYVDDSNFTVYVVDSTSLFLRTSTCG